jgi:hypothetical protein
MGNHRFRKGIDPAGLGHPQSFFGRLARTLGKKTFSDLLPLQGTFHLPQA